MFSYLEYFEGIIITNNEIKNKILKYFSQRKKLVSFSFKTYQDLIDVTLGSYDINAILELGKNNSFELSNILLENALLIESEDYNEKIKELYAINKRFITKKKLPFSKDKIILVIDYYYDNDAFNKSLKILQDNNYKVEYNYITNEDKKEILINEYDTQKKEVFSVVRKIASLIKTGVNLNKINLYYGDSNYQNLFAETFSLYKIPVNFNKKNALFEYKITRDFIKFLEKNEDVYLDDLVLDSKYVYNKLGKYLFAILNSLMEKKRLVKDVLDYIKYMAKNTYVDRSEFLLEQQNVNCINVLKDYNTVLSDDEYLFICGLNQNCIPIIHKDNEYINDDEKKSLGLLTTTSKNLYEKIKIKNIVSRTSNICISYSLMSSSNTLIPSPVIEEMKKCFVVNVISEESVISSNRRESILQFNRAYDEYNKFDIVNNDLKTLNKYFKYRKFSSNNNVKKQGKLADFVNKGMILSYTSINEYYQCPYKFYLNKVLKIKSISNKNDRSLLIGNLFHHVLYKCLLLNIDAEDEQAILGFISEFYTNENIIITKELQVFNEIYFFYLKKVYQFIKKTMDVSCFKVKALEEEHVIFENNGFILNGKIDKVLTAKIDNEEYAIVIDYKTGEDEINLNNVIYGLDMQLLIYFYFLNNQKKYKFAGGYLSHILPNNILNFEKDKSYDALLNEFYKLSGYSNIDIKTLKRIDKNVEKDTYLKGIKFYKNTTDLNANALKRVISNEDYENLLQIVYNKISTVIDNVHNSKFPIKPVALKKAPCIYCDYKEICYVSDKDINKVESYENLSFIREETK